MSDEVNDGKMPRRDDGVVTGVVSTAESVIRSAKLNPFVRLSINPVSFRVKVEDGKSIEVP